MMHILAQFEDDWLRTFLVIAKKTDRQTDRQTHTQTDKRTDQHTWKNLRFLPSNKKWFERKIKWQKSPHVQSSRYLRELQAQKLTDLFEFPSMSPRI